MKECPVCKVQHENYDNITCSRSCGHKLRIQKMGTLKKDEIKTCLWCKKKYKNVNFYKGNCCSISCGKHFHNSIKPRKIYECEVCGEEKNKRYRTCSHSCGTILRHKEQGNPKWKNYSRQKTFLRTTSIID